MSMVQTNGYSFYYEVRGDGPETIFFINGWLLGTLQFEGVANRLADRFRCVLFDHRNQGRTPMQDVSIVGTETSYEDAVGVLKAVGNPPAHLVGCSMGGWIGIRIAARQPQLVRSLIVMQTSLDAAEDDLAGRDELDAQLSKIERAGFDNDESISMIMNTMYGETYRRSAGEAEIERWRELIHKVDPRIIAPMRGLNTRLGIEFEAGYIKAPTLILSGAEDWFFAPAVHRRIQEAIPGSTMKIIDGAAHSPPVEQPDRVVREIDEFITHVGRAS